MKRQRQRTMTKKQEGNQWRNVMSGWIQGNITKYQIWMDVYNVLSVIYAIKQTNVGEDMTVRRKPEGIQIIKATGTIP